MGDLIEYHKKEWRSTYPIMVVAHGTLVLLLNERVGVRRIISYHTHTLDVQPCWS